MAIKTRLFLQKKKLLLFSCVRTFAMMSDEAIFTIIHYFTIIFFSGGRPYTYSPRVYPCNEISSLGNQTWHTNDWKLIENWLIEIISKMKFLLHHLVYGLRAVPCWCSLNAFWTTCLFLLRILWWDLRSLDANLFFSDEISVRELFFLSFNVTGWKLNNFGIYGDCEEGDKFYVFKGMVGKCFRAFWLVSLWDWHVNRIQGKKLKLK